MGTPEKSESQQADSPTQPSWIDKALIQRALRNAGDEKSVVAAIAVSRAAAAGDNYASAIYRVKATLSDGKERSFIIKGPAPGDALANMVKESGVFPRETAMLTEVIPKMEALLEAAAPGRLPPLAPRCYLSGSDPEEFTVMEDLSDSLFRLLRHALRFQRVVLSQALLEAAAPGRFPPLAPRCYLSGSDPVEFIVMEDLSDSHFRLADRMRGLGLRHSLLAIHNIARFHAASYALLQRQPELVAKFDNTWRKDFGKTMQVFLGVEFQAAADACRTWPGFEQYADRLEKFKDTALDLFIEMNDPKPGAFNVITHGDFHANNMMFCYTDGMPSGYRAIDLQLSHVASPVLDILYCLSGSVSENVHTNHLDLLFREYHFKLKATMELLGHQAPTIEALRETYEAHGSFALFIALALPLMQADKGVDFDALMKGDNSSFAPLFNSPFIKRWMQRVLPDYARRGWLPAA